MDQILYKCGNLLIRSSRIASEASLGNGCCIQRGILNGPAAALAFDPDNALPQLSEVLDFISSMTGHGPSSVVVRRGKGVP